MAEGNNRNYGIDILRAVSMLMVVILHILYHGGALIDCELNSFNYFYLHLILTIVWCGVDIFAIISGFVGFRRDSNHNLAGYIRLWLRVSFINVMITVLFSIIHPSEISIKRLVLSMFPVSSYAYWYFTAYSFVFLLSPALNHFLSKTDSNADKLILCVGLCLLYLSHFQTGIFSIALLVYLYCLGSLIKKYNIHLRISRKKSIMVSVVLILFTWLWNIIISPVNSSIGGLWLRYDSPTIICLSALSVMLFARKTIDEKNIGRIIGLITPSIFSVYLVNDNQFLRSYLITDKFRWFSNANPLVILGTLILAVIAFFLGSITLDLIRRWLEKIVRVDRISIWIEDTVRKMSDKVVIILKCFVS